jgi:signal transduction histidine kinase/ActR/RegA family two-component response regulator
MKEEIATVVGMDPARHVLVVDDDRDLADSLTRLLELEGYRVETAYSAEAAIETIKQNPVAVALVDIRLGQDNGVRLIHDLQACRPEVVVIMMTAYVSVDTAIQAIQEGAYDYLCKPFITEDLLATLQRCVERIKLVRERQAAEAAVRARNRELRALNLRLGKILRSMQLLARRTTAKALCHQLLSAMIELLRGGGGAFYLRDGDVLRALAVNDGEYAEVIDLPPLGATVRDALARQQPGGQGRAQVVFPLLESSGALLGALFVHDPKSRQFSRQGVELGQILVSFGAEAIQAAQAAEDLAESRERLSKIVDNSPSAISLKDLEGRYLLANAKFDDWFGTSMPDTEPPDGNGAAAEFVPDSTVLASGGAINREIEVTLADGAKHSILVTRFRVIDGVGEPCGVGTIGTDITEQRLAEQQLRQAQRIEALGQLTGGIAHDFNNLLSVILGSLRLLQEETAGQPSAQALLEDALDATVAGADLTSRLLAFGRGQTLRPQMTDICTLVLEISRMLERTLDEGIAIRLELPFDLWHAEIDQNQLKTSLLNVAINARDAMPEGGTLVIRAQNISLDHNDVRSRPDMSPGDYVVLAVEDCGEGMPPDVLRRAIQPFFTTKEPGQGTGLGLSMVYGFVKQSKGHLELASEVGQGTTVSLFFPASVHGAVCPTARESAPPAGAGHGERILVVEDQPSVRRMTRRLLTRLGYKVLEASDCQSALNILEENGDIDVLFTDIVLPGGTNGVMLGREALARNPDLRVVYTTGYAVDSPAIEQHLQDTTTILLHKPVQVEALSQVLRSVLERR